MPPPRSRHAPAASASADVRHRRRLPASDRRDRQAPAIFLDLIVWESQAQSAAEHLVKGQAVSFSGRFNPREYTTSAGQTRLALEVHDIAIEYGPKPRTAEPDNRATADAATDRADEHDIPF